MQLHSTGPTTALTSRRFAARGPSSALPMPLLEITLFSIAVVGVIWLGIKKSDTDESSGGSASDSPIAKTWGWITVSATVALYVDFW